MKLQEDRYELDRRRREGRNGTEKVRWEMDTKRRKKGMECVKRDE